MPTVTATAFAKEFGKYQHVAREEVVAVTSHGRTIGYYLSAREYEDLRAIEERSRRNVRAGELSEDMLAAIAESRMDPRHAHLDALMDD